MTCCSAIACSSSRSRRSAGSSEACRLMGVHRSTYYRWKAQVERQGLEMLRPRERRRPQMPNQLSVHGRAADRGVRARPSRASDRGGSRHGWRARSGAALVVSPNGVYKTLCRHGLNTRAKRLALVAGYRAPYRATTRTGARAAHRHAPAGRAGRDRLLLCRPAARHQGPGLADHRDRHLQQLRVGRSRRHSGCWADRRADLRAGPARRRRAATGRLAARARAL